MGLFLKPQEGAWNLYRSTWTTPWKSHRSFYRRVYLQETHKGNPFLAYDKI